MINNLLLLLYDLLLEEQDSLRFNTIEMINTPNKVERYIIRLNMDKSVNNVILIGYNPLSEMITLWLRRYCPWSQDVFMFELVCPDSIDNVLTCIRTARHMY